MKVLPLKKLCFSNAPLKIISLFLGYSFWYIATINQTIAITLSVPLYFTNSTDAYTIEAPESITIVLQGKRSHLYAIDTSSLAAHITINKQEAGKYGIILNEKHLFLPPTISLLQYTPANISCTLHAKTTQEIL